MYKKHDETRYFKKIVKLYDVIGGMYESSEAATK